MSLIFCLRERENRIFFFFREYYNYTKKLHNKMTERKMKYLESESELNEMKDYYNIII